MALAKRKGVVGVDLGHAILKVVQIERAGTGYKVVRSGSAPTPPDAIKDGMVVDPAAVGEALRTAMRDAHIHAGQATVAAAGGTVFVRAVPYPMMTGPMLRESLKFEAGRYIPGSADESYVEAEILEGQASAAVPTDDAHMAVLLVAAPKDLVNSRIAACEAAGLEVQEVDIEAFATYRAVFELDAARVEGQPTGQVGTTALLDLGALKTSVSVIQGGAFVMHRTLPIGGRGLTEALAGYFHLEDADAEAGKAVLDAAELLNGQASDNPPLRVIQPLLDDLVRELKRSFNYFQSQGASGASGVPGSKPGAPEAAEAPPAQVESILLCGGAARLTGLAAYLEAKLGLPVATAGLYDNPAIVHNGVHEDAGLDLTVAAGLALRPLVARAPAKGTRPKKEPFRKSAPEAQAA